MEPKKDLKRLEKLKQMSADAIKRNDAIIVKLCNEILPTVDGISDDMFDKAIEKKINALASSASDLLKKKQQTVAEQEIYCISLLSFCFFDRFLEASIEKKKVKIIDKRP